jgi:putative oxidoreductase
MNASANKFFPKKQDIGLLFLRVVVGAIMLVYGGHKILGGQQCLLEVGSAIRVIGVNFLFVFWGSCAALSEIIGGLFLVIGFFFRPSCLFLTFTMLIATLHNLSLAEPSAESILHSFVLCVTFFSMLFTGPGKYSL